MPTILDMRPCACYDESMINLMLMLLNAIFTLGASTPDANAMMTPPPAPQGDYLPDPICEEDELRFDINDDITICSHIEGDGMRIIITID